MPLLHLSGSELYTAGLEFASRRLPDAALYQMDCRRIPFDADFDVVCAFDVLEHVEEDQVALGEMFRSVRPGGGVIVSVPQHPWLWSAGDDYAHHKRRYRRAELVSKMRAAGFEVERVTSFVSFLLPLMAVSRSRQRDAGTYDPKAEYRSPRAVDRTMESVLETERWLIGRGVSLPAGGSLVAVARRPK
jgi:SAM-dependent methyltransferase